MASATRTAILHATLLLAVAATPSVEAEDSLSIRADAPVVPLSLRAPGRHSLRLPALEYRFAIQVQCAANRSPESLSLSVADTRKSFAADEIVANGLTEFSLRIPARQIAPLVIEGFCVAPDNGNLEKIGASREFPDRITIPAALSAQASLLCSSDGHGEMTYVSRPLDVALVCERTSAEADAGADKTLLNIP